MLKLKVPSNFQPNIQQIDDAIALSYDPWDLRILAYSYEELEEYVLEHVSLIWRLLVDTDISNLNKRGREIRDKLLEDFEDVPTC